MLLLSCEHVKTISISDQLILSKRGLPILAVIRQQLGITTETKTYIYIVHRQHVVILGLTG